jgi:translation initiation factor 5B
MITENKIRQPIVTVCGHVDHGKTTLLDKLRGSCIQEGEAGGITQKISFTTYPLVQLNKACPLIEKSGIKLNIPGFLFIDTPGHAAFTNLRKRGGSLADLAVLVIDITDGIKPQTAEVISLLKRNKTPFIIALNKIDKISGWNYKKGNSLKESIESQSQQVQQRFQELYMTLIGSLNSHGFDADLYYNISDFTKKIALIPTSGETEQGIPELTLMLCGLSQKYLGNKLTLGEEAKGVILEVKKDNSINYAEAILYDGTLSKKEEIAISNLEGIPIISKIRVLEEILPLCSKFKPKDEVKASTGIKIQLITKEEIPAGMPFMAYRNNLEEIKEKFKEQVSESISSSLSKKGLIVKADSLGSLEALLVLLKQANLPVLKAGIGRINKTDIISAKANREIDEIDAIILGFNVKIDEEAQELYKGYGEKSGINILTEKVVYKLIENAIELREKKKKEIEKERMMRLSSIAKAEILHQYVFRNTNPTIFGIKIIAGKLKKNTNLIAENGEKVGTIKALQLDKNSVEEGKENQELAISIKGTNYERQLKDKRYLYTEIGESTFKEFKKNKDLLSENEKKALSEIAEIKRKENPSWGV